MWTWTVIVAGLWMLLAVFLAAWMRGSKRPPEVSEQSVFGQMLRRAEVRRNNILDELAVLQDERDTAKRIMHREHLELHTEQLCQLLGYPMNSPYQEERLVIKKWMYDRQHNLEFLLDSLQRLRWVQMEGDQIEH